MTGRSACITPAFRRVQTFPLSTRSQPQKRKGTRHQTASVQPVAPPSAHWSPVVVLPAVDDDDDDEDDVSIVVAVITHAKARLKETLTSDLLEKLRRFWFKHLNTDESYILPQRSQMGRWFYSDVDFDEACVKRFRPVTEAMKSAKITARDILTIVRPFTPLQWLSLVLLLDQVPRNIYRGPESSTVFKFFDPVAREIAQHAINAGAATHNRIKYRVAYRMWFYLPFMHSEDLALHDLAVAQYQQMKADFEKLMADDGTAGSDDQRKCWGVLAVQKEAARDLLETNCDFETKHRDIIVQFGRYPHRNMAMGRESTAQEKKYLETGGETFDGAR
ncbi:hypothetical protein CORC01_02272 [Colletotrichum orchidophilum]|uniref:DUF924 domain-containing protein n=1 Tax=Colletotrichum orchidophilum TaxID=1209926 RepID=A0A1G4BMP4_9PEZI|nr:uncharacterized protein CORC01_02272 [Colletotrichum orchidophilum]OHF02577.1 hypothetical protein CORC01_02272 [Colletotrichum orchidophilum]